MTWILWLAAAAAITQTLGGSLNCANDSFFVYCGQLNALEGFAWLIWFVFESTTRPAPNACFIHRVILTLILIVLLIRGIMSGKNGNGVQGGLVDEV